MGSLKSRREERKCDGLLETPHAASVELDDFVREYFRVL